MCLSYGFYGTGRELRYLGGQQVVRLPSAPSHAFSPQPWTVQESDSTAYPSSAAPTRLRDPDYLSMLVVHRVPNEQPGHTVLALETRRSPGYPGVYQSWKSSYPSRGPVYDSKT